MPPTPAMKKGDALQREIARTKLKEGEAGIWWMGQATFCLKVGGSLIYYDPYFRDADQKANILGEMPLRPGEMTGASLMCCSHDHIDHTDPLTLPVAAKASPGATILLPYLSWKVARSAGVPARRMRVMRGDDSFTAGGLHVTALPSAHMDLQFSPRTGHRFLGYVIQGNGVTLYHPGDTQPYACWRERVDRFELDIALLPINGNDNLFYQQAVYFCAIHRPRLVIPIHYGHSPGNTEDPRKFAKLLKTNVPDQKFRILKAGERFVYRRRKGV